MSALVDLCRSMNETELQRVARRRRVRRLLIACEAVITIAGFALLARAGGMTMAISFFLIVQAGYIRAARKGL